MRVLGVVPRYPPGSRVGAWLATHRFLSHLAARGHEVDVLAYLGSGPTYTLDGVRVHSRRLRPTATDVVVGHLGDNGSAGMWASRMGVPLVGMVHGPNPDPVRLTSTALAVFNSESSLKSAAFDGAAVVCHPPTIPDDHRVERTGVAVTLVNCSKPKGIKTLWRVAERLPDRQFLGVKGGYGTQITPRAANFPVIPAQPNMRTVWAQTQVLAMPSEVETWGMVGIEAMCSGIPVIAHPTPGLQESLGPAGIFVDRDDIDGWVSAIEALDDPATYAAASERARARVAELDPVASLERFATAVEALT